MKGKQLGYVIYISGIGLAIVGLIALISLIRIGQIQPSATLSLYLAACFGGLSMAVAGASFVSSSSVHEKLDELLKRTKQ